MKSTSQKLMAAVLASLLMWGALHSPAMANGAPVNVILTYLDGISNWGPTDAAGVMELVKEEGEIRLTVANLPPLADEAYEVWLFNTRDNTALSGGRFNTNARGDATYHKVLANAIESKGYNLAFISVADGRASAGASTSPSGRISIAGFLPQNLLAEGAWPSQLPGTGQPGGASASDPLGWALLGAAIALLVVNLANTAFLIWRRWP